MAKLDTRRAMLGRTAGLLVAAGNVPSQAADAGLAEDYYDKLGVKKIINAAGTYTVLTAATMPPSVRAAVAASSALTLGTAAAIGIMNDAPIEAVPTKVDRLKRNEVLIQKAHRYSYDHAIENCGAKFIEVESLDDYRKAFTNRTVMAHFFNAAESGSISREDWVAVAREHQVPSFNDAAADVPPISNLWAYTKLGFDLVTFSGGKGIRGPQNAGLLLGRKNLITAASATNSPFDEGVGRGMKVAKEQIVGMVAAVDWLLSQSDESMQTEFRRRADRISADLKSIPTIEARIVVPPVANHVPHLLLRYDQQRVKISPREVAMRLREGNPSIELNPSTGHREGSAGLPSDENTIVVGVWMLEPGEDALVGHRLREVLSSASNG